MNAARLLEYFDRIAEAPDAISRLRKFVLDLAVRGKLVEQDPNDEPASELMRDIEKAYGLSFSKIDGFDSALFIVPNGWEWMRLGDLMKDKCRSLVNCAYDEVYCLWSVPAYFTGKPEIVKGREVGSPKREISCGDILLSKINPHLNRVWITGGYDDYPQIASSEWIVLNSYGTSASLLKYFLTSNFFLRQFCSVLSGIGGSLTRVRPSDAQNYLVPLPPLAEQHRIVAKVDELMALCDRLEASQARRESRRDRLASASLKRIGQPEDVGNGEEFRENVRFHLHHLPRLATRPEHVKELRHTILNLAVRGKLVPQKKNEATERSKLTRYVVEERKLSGFRQDIPSGDFESLGIDIQKYNFPSSWEVMKLSEIALIIVDCPHSTPRWVESGVLCVRTSQFKPGFLDITESRYVSSDTYIERIQRIEPRCDDILYSREGGILGVACRVPENIRLCLGQRMMLFRMSSVCLPRFAELILNSPLITELARQKTTGGAAPRVNVALIKSYPMPVPPLAEQHRIVAKVDELMKLCDKLEVQLAANQTNQSRLLEATLCDALGVTCLPVSRPSRPAPTLARVAATHSEQPPKPITPRPGFVETPTTAVQGSLIEQPTPQVGKPRAANGDAPGAILAHMRPGQEYSRAQLAEALGLSVYEWNMAIRELKESGRVVQTGERRGARYRIN
jgi:type I restriction enzyme S subunit